MRILMHVHLSYYVTVTYFFNLAAIFGLFLFPYMFKATILFS